ncbi:MAG: hypothetical protein ACRC4T_19320 [Cetobacterium sp.]
MKKIFTLIIVLSSFAFGKGLDNVLDSKIENELRRRNVIQVSNYKVDYDVDVYANQMNIEIEFDGIREPKLDYKKIALKVITIAREIAPNIDDIYIDIKFDPLIGEDRVLFSKRYSK